MFSSVFSEKVDFEHNKEISLFANRFIDKLNKKLYTVTYRAPEIENKKVSLKSDIWALGCTFYEIIKGTALYGLIYTDGIVWELAIQTLWDEETQGIFAAIISFWFGSRALQRSRSSS